MSLRPRPSYALLSSKIWSSPGSFFTFSPACNTVQRVSLCWLLRWPTGFIRTTRLYRQQPSQQCSWPRTLSWSRNNSNNFYLAATLVQCCGAPGDRRQCWFAQTADLKLLGGKVAKRPAGFACSTWWSASVAWWPRKSDHSQDELCIIVGSDGSNNSS